MALLAQHDKRTSVFLFPGVNSVIRWKDRRRALGFEEVQSRLFQAQIELHNLGEDRSLLGHLEKHPRELCNADGLGLTAACVLAIQLGVTDRLGARGIFPDWVMGCSLGDVARSVYCESLSFEDAIFLHHRFFSDYRSEVERYSGITLGVWSQPQRPFAIADLDWFSQNGLAVSMMSPNVLQLSCNHQNLKILSHKASIENWILKKSDFSMMLHTVDWKNLCNRVISAPQMAMFGQPRVPIFSSILNRPILKANEIREEASKALWLPLNWYDSILSLKERHRVKRFINIGPCKSLSILLRNFSPPVRTVDGVSLVS